MFTALRVNTTESTQFDIGCGNACLSNFHNLCDIASYVTAGCFKRKENTLIDKLIKPSIIGSCADEFLVSHESFNRFTLKIATVYSEKVWRIA